MMFVAQVGDSEEVSSFIAASSRRIGLGYVGWMKVFSGGRVFVCLQPVVPPVWRYLALGIFGFIAVFKGLSPWLVLSLLPLLVDVFLSTPVQFWVFSKGLRKAGYTGSVSRIPLYEFLEAELR